MLTMKLIKAIAKVDKLHYGLFAAGAAFGTAGVKILSSKDAKGVYAKTVAVGLRAKDSVMKTVNKIQENAEDVLAEARQINEDRAEAEEAAMIDADLDEVVSVDEIISDEEIDIE